MATRSRIGIQLKDESVLSVYCHWDGYPEFNGKKLQEHFNSYEKAAELIDGGDMSSCWTDGHCDDSTDGTYGPEYYSKRGEDCPPRLDVNLNEYLSNGEEYWYLFTNGEWKCYTPEGNEVKIPA